MNEHPPIEEFRSLMPIAQRWAYFDHAAIAPISGPAYAAIEQWARDALQNGDANYPEWTDRLSRLRSLAAECIGAESSEIALLSNTTAGINAVAEGFPWLPGDNVVTRADEFPSNQYPWLNLANRGVDIRRLPVGEDGSLDLNRLADACDGRTRIVTLSWVAYANGWRHDLDQVARLVHDRGALLLVDAIQGLGVFPLDVRRTPIDFLAADGHKWLLGPEGAALFYCRREHLDRLRPMGVGWKSVINEHDFARISLDLKPAAERYEGGSPNCAGMIGLGASLELLASFGFDAIATRVLELTDLACELLVAEGAQIVSNREGQHCSGIVTFTLPGADHQQVRQHCLKHKVVLSCRGGGLRISPHAYNNEADLDRLLEAIRSV
jgi:cysteine desulfurase / selenocysteine lyase